MGCQEEESVEFRWIKLLENQRRPPLNSLVNICAHYISNHLKETVLCWKGAEELNALLHPHQLRPSVCLPVEVSQTIFDYVEDYEEPDVIATFGSIKKITPTVQNEEEQSKPKVNPMPIENLNFTNTTMKDSTFCDYMRTNARSLRAVNISRCKRLTHRSLATINDYGRQLTSLNIGEACQVLNLPHQDLDSKQSTLLWGPKQLQKFILHGHQTLSGSSIRFYHRLLNKYTETLSHLDLSGCYFGSRDDFMFLSSLLRLKALILYDVDLRTGFYDVIEKLPKTIRHLDISQPGSKLNTAGSFPSPNEFLGKVARTLVNLDSLDISGTNLAGTGVAEMSWDDCHEGGMSPAECCDIPGLNCRSKRPLEYLGLYNTAHDASHRHFIPAKLIGGDKDEKQIINAARAFIDRHSVLEKILNDLFHLFRSEQGHRVVDCLRVILLSMERHPEEKHIQISGSASLFYIVKNNQANVEILSLKQRILMAIVTAMDEHQSDPTMMRNGCLTICHFKIPQDVMFIYEKLVKTLLNTLGGVNQVTTNEDFVERIAIYLLNSLACQVEGEQKRLVGDLGAMAKMLALIEARLMRHECDDVMEIAWSTMWNVTDETPENCHKFLTHRGMDLFLQCLQTFPNQPELLRNMMGLLGNVAEVKHLRRRLMTSEFIKVFYNLLDSKQDNIEVSYNAAGVLAHILSDGPEAWEAVHEPLRSDVCSRMARNIKEWNMDSPRNINYRSFKPILRLLLVEHTLECRLWAAWALANLTSVYPDKYVKLLVEEGGLNYLVPQKDSDESEDLRNYARIACTNVEAQSALERVKAGNKCVLHG